MLLLPRHRHPREAEGRPRPLSWCARLRRALVKGSLDGEFMHVTDLRDDDIVGKNVEVLWPDDGLFYPATVISARAVAPDAPTTSATEKAREAEETKSDTAPNEDDDATLVARRGERVMLVYPMTSDLDGRVFMHAKTVDRRTAQLRYSRVCVYSFVHDEEERYFDEFSLFPTP